MRRTRRRPSLAALEAIAAAVFRVAFERWVDGEDDLSLRDVIRESMAQLGRLAGREHRDEP